MPEKSVRILNFDDSLTKQHSLISEFNPVIIDLKNIGPEARIWASRKTIQKIKSILNPGQKDFITFLGSGDFHHISGILIGQFEEPITVIVFDYHPDWDIMPPVWGCGSWVRAISGRTNIDKIILIGVSSSDISSISIQTGNIASLKDNRLEIYPYSHRPSRVIFRRIPPNISIDVTRGKFLNTINWHEIKDKFLSEFFAEIIKRIKAKKVYISIDKDCLKKDCALTNWEEGSLKFEELSYILKLIKENFDIVGADIAGDYSEPIVKGAIKKMFSHLDHPKEFSAKRWEESFINSVNEKTNLKILELLR